MMSRKVSGLISRKRWSWSNLMPLFIALVVVSEITFLGRLDMAKNVAMVQSWTNTFYYPSSSSLEGRTSMEYSSLEGSKSMEYSALGNEEKWVGAGDCEEWLEREDAVTYSRDFEKDPVLVSGAEQVGFPFWVLLFCSSFYFFE